MIRQNKQQKSADWPDMILNFWFASSFKEGILKYHYIFTWGRKLLS